MMTRQSLEKNRLSQSATKGEPEVDYSQSVPSTTFEEPNQDELLFEVERDSAGQRLDRFVAARIADVSRARVQQWIELGAVEVDGHLRPGKYRLHGYENVMVRPLPRHADSAFASDPVPLALVYADSAILVIDKPAGLVTHPAAGNWRDTLMNGLLHHWPLQSALPRAGIVHRLDKDTSGLLVVARTEAAVMRLTEQLADRTMSRKYLALVEGCPPEAGTVDAPVGRDPVVPVRMAVVQGPRGRNAITHFSRLASGQSPNGRQVSLMLCQLESGRTHQIRVHFKHLGHPLVGDAIYGKADKQAPINRQALHAWQLGLKHPDTGGVRSFGSALPADFLAALEACGIQSSILPTPP